MAYTSSELAYSTYEAINYLPNQTVNWLTRGANWPTRSVSWPTQSANLPTRGTNWPTQSVNWLTRGTNWPTQSVSWLTRETNWPTQRAHWLAVNCEHFAYTSRAFPNSRNLLRTASHKKREALSVPSAGRLPNSSALPTHSPKRK